MEALSAAMVVTPQVLADAQNITIIQKGEGSVGNGARAGSWTALVVVVAWLCLY